MVNGKVKAVLDSNILISAFLYGGKPQQIIDLLIESRFIAITSPILLAEVLDVFAKKFKFSNERLIQTESEIKQAFQFVHPSFILRELRDEDDNRVLEAAAEGRCDFIVTGDLELLNLKIFRGIKILTPAQFLQKF
ncbi:MAG: putative toxin-antitoxin system toxin component, PIN family [Candidatus Doudnabacteria bacterium RIFCSPHIGHO2_01_FULL_46_14]|uniref:Putative toxin-antitoxin system toxin component, PIN family n=1 Tax=Candidatus Doudnabacteria bacterium RIFCSPHIGHO2_01_FULL_46_14 TaxID=1817824 RepID=A0A1F5NN46_9BACT|nr:MAG: putative toxin-antitoxin system toxin component, PIN family [Candidatus Doudnabacteria bacterium RIFCSPHIGHO2_01_FULL_46_14]